MPLTELDTVLGVTFYEAPQPMPYRKAVRLAGLHQVERDTICMILRIGDGWMPSSLLPRGRVPYGSASRFIAQLPDATTVFIQAEDWGTILYHMERAEYGDIVLVDLCYAADTHRFILRDDAYYHEYGQYDGLYCERDADEYDSGYDDDDYYCRDDHDGQVFGYHSRERGNTHEPYNVSVELEVKLPYGSQGRKDVLHWVNDGDEIIPEQDGSLHSDGVELIQKWSAPYKETIELWKNVMPLLPSQKGLVGYGNHITICASGWTDAQRVMFTAFWTANEDFAVGIAHRRYNDSYAVKGTTPVSDEGCTEKYNSCYGNKYSACAVRDVNRIEVRMFRTCNRIETLATRLELVDAIARWCDQPKVSFKHVTDIASLKRWLFRKRADYPNAYRYTKRFIASLKEDED